MNMSTSLTNYSYPIYVPLLPRVDRWRVIVLALTDGYLLLESVSDE